MDALSCRATARLLLVALFLACLTGSNGSARAADDADETQWIWSTVYPQGKAPTGICYFRKTFELADPESASIQITCDDRFDLYVNGQRAGAGNDWHLLQTIDIKKYLRSGKNLIAVRAESAGGPGAGLVARLICKSAGGTWAAYSTDSSWRVKDQELPGWELPGHNDARWQAAKVLGAFATTEPWRDQIKATGGGQARRFTIVKDFRIERVLAADATGSLIAMAFNEWGELLLSRERGPLLLVVDKNEDGIPETVTTFCDKVNTCQGILALNGRVFVVAEGPEGAGFYRLDDDDQDGQCDQVKLLFPFDPGISEHGPHAATLGPDGFIYLMIGNHAAVKKEFAASSPHRYFYEGDLNTPKYEDPGGHAVGIKAPCGTVVRTDPEGTFVELFAGGFRNAYDIAFNRQGELLTFDSDMEWDEGLPWYRPTRIEHVIAGGEYGSRSGWSPFPAYAIDNLPPMVDTDRGSPTGVEVYNHVTYPPAYHNALFACDWSQGRILAVKMKPQGGSYQADVEVFLQGRPLNVTDLAVGADGWLYFCTGGRGTEGGVYRVVWNGEAAPPQPKTPIARAILQPQLNSAWARQNLAGVREEMGEAWGPELLALAEDTKLRPEERTRALDLLQLFGPEPNPTFLAKLLRDRQAEVRAKAAYLLGLHVDEAAAPAIVGLLRDADATVRRVACETISRGDYPVAAASLVPLLGDKDRFVAWAARRALEELEPDEWQPLVLQSKNVRVFCVGSLGLMASAPQAERAEALIQRGLELLGGYLSDDDFVDLMRVFALALERGEVPASAVPELTAALAKEYPTGQARMNRELTRLLVYLQEPSFVKGLLEVLSSDAPPVEKLHAALHARFLKEGWTTQQRMTVLRYLEEARALPGGLSFKGYIDGVERDFCATFSAAEQRLVLAQGARMPNAALQTLAALPEGDLPDELLSRVIALDTEVATAKGDDFKRLQTGLVAVLGGSKNPQAMAHLREAFEKQPERREDLAMGLAQSPGGENWPLLVRSLPVVQGIAAQEVLMQLAGCEEKPEGGEPVRQVLLCGLRLGNGGGQHAIALLQKWTGQQVTKPNSPAEPALAVWQKWFAEQYPDLPPAELPVETEDARWTLEQLVDVVSGPTALPARAERGAAVFDRAQCAKCHRFGGRGEGIGPDLSTVGQRFQKREIVESILFPSHVVSDQYASKTITTTDGLSYTGLVGAAGDEAVVVLQTNGEKVTVKKADIAETAPQSKSAMPEGLLNTLSAEEIADLFAYLTQPLAIAAPIRGGRTK